MNWKQFNFHANFFPCATLLVSTDGGLQEANEAAVEFFGLSKSELLKKTIFELSNTQEPTIREHLFIAARTRSTIPGSLHLIRNAQTAIFCRCDSALYAAASNELPAIVILQFHPRDVSPSKFQILTEKIELLEKANRSLLREIEEREAAQRQLREKTIDLERSNAELARFAFVASHDLKEPLRVVSNYVQILEMRYREKLDSQANTFIKFITDGVDRMYNLINDLLTYSSIAEEHTESIDCSKVLRSVLSNLEASVLESGAEITIGALPVVSADYTYLTQVFQNLLSNAIKFRRGSSPKISVSGERVNGNWLFSVSDNGIGIPEEYFDKIFVLFQRLHRKDEYSGTGIGLALCKKIVERLGGNIWVESEVGKGATFYFSVPGEKVSAHGKQ